MAGRAEASGSSVSVFEVVNLKHVRCFYLLNNKLSDAHRMLDDKRLLAEVDKDYPDLMRIVPIHDSCERVEPAVERESGARADAPIGTRRHCKG